MKISFNLPAIGLGLSLALFASAASSALATPVPALTGNLLQFDFSQAGSLTSASTIRFSNAVNVDLYDAQWNIIGQHWVADPDPSTPAVALESMSTYGYNGSAAPGVTGLQALFQPVLVQFSAPVKLNSLSLLQDDSRYGYPGMASLVFLNAQGQQIGASIDYVQNATSFIGAGQVSGDVSAILLSSGKFYRSLDVRVAAVPEPATTAMLLAGLGIVAAVARRRQRAG